jgi:CheY-like chemotaxis protein
MDMDEIRRRAKALGIEHAERMNKAELVRRIQVRDGSYPCFDQQWCRPAQHRRCVWNADCQAHLEPAQGLVLSDNVIIGHQVASLLRNAYGWDMQVTHRDKQAYALILQGNMDVVIADIDTVDLGGLAVLAYAKHHWTSITTFGITESRDAYLKRLARDMGGCQGFFYVAEGRLEIDPRVGMAGQLLRGASSPMAAKVSAIRD